MYAPMRANDHIGGHHHRKSWRRHSRTGLEKCGFCEGKLQSQGETFTSCMEKMQNCISWNDIIVTAVHKSRTRAEIPLIPERYQNIHGGVYSSRIFRGYEEEATETFNNAQAIGYSVEQFGEDEPAMAEEAELDPQLAEELRAFMDANDTRAAEALVNALNRGQRRVFDILIAHFQRQPLENGPDISQHCRTSSGSSVPQSCAVLTGVAGSGKSYVVRLLIAKLRALGLGILVCGSSGVGALNVGGRTIHSLLSLSLDLE